jgi:hypothetical protein
MPQFRFTKPLPESGWRVGLRARISQVWINPWTVALLLVLVRFLFVAAQARADVERARQEALDACVRAGETGSFIASMPHYMAAGVNEVLASGIESSVGDLTSLLDTSISRLETTVFSVVHMVITIYSCFITLAVQTIVDVVVEVGMEESMGVNEAVDEVTKSLRLAGKTLSESLSSMNIDRELNSTMNDVPSPAIDFHGLVQKSVCSRSTYESNQSAPSLADIRKTVDNITSSPFAEIKRKMHAVENFHFDRALLPVPAQPQLDFCTKESTTGVACEDLIQAVTLTRKIVLIVLLVLAVLICFPVAWMEISRDKRTKRLHNILGSAHTSDEELYLLLQDPPYQLASWGLSLSRRFHTPSHSNAFLWLFAYGTSAPMQFVFTLGMAGLISSLLQFLLVKRIGGALPHLTREKTDFAGDVMLALQTSSTWWSDKVNDAVRRLDGQLHGDIYDLVNATTSAVDANLDAFIERTSGIVEHAVNGSSLHEHTKNITDTLYDWKAASFQRVLVWVQGHGHVAFPLVKNNTLTLGTIVQLNDSRSVADLLGDLGTLNNGAVTKAAARSVDMLKSSVYNELLTASALVLSWLLLIAGGIIRVSFVLLTTRREKWSMFGNLPARSSASVA